MLTVMRKVDWWGVVEDHQLRFASPRQTEAEQAGDPVPITIHYPIERAITAEEMFEVLKRIADKDIAYVGFLEQVGSRMNCFDRHLDKWLKEDGHWRMVRASIGDEMFEELGHAIKRWIYNHE